MLPDKWYVLYNNREEFDIINDYYNMDWSYFEQTTPKKYGYSNIDISFSGDRWIDDNYYDLKILQEKDAVEITFREFRKYVLGESLSDHKANDTKYLIKLFKKLKIT